MTISIISSSRRQVAGHNWLQLHLATCVCVMLGSGMLIWMNMKNFSTKASVSDSTVGTMFLYQGSPISFEAETGWPFAFYSWRRDNLYRLQPDGFAVVTKADFYDKSGMAFYPYEISVTWNYLNILLNFFACLVLLVGLAAILEMWSYRRGSGQIQSDM